MTECSLTPHHPKPDKRPVMSILTYGGRFLTSLPTKFFFLAIDEKGILT